MDDITIIYLDQEVVIPGLRCEVLERQNRYLALAEKAEKKFLQKYYDKYGDFFVFANKYAEDVSDFLRPYYKSMIHELVECGIYDASIDGIFQKYGEFLAKSLLELQNGIKDLCNRASDGMETAMAVRELRKATRTQMVGGGFGLTGALAGMAVSGAYNTVSGLLHSGANAIGNSRTRLKINEKFQNLYKSADFRELVGKCIWDSVFSIKYVIEDCLGHVEVIPDSEYKSKAKALRSNFPRIPDDDKHEVVQEILTLAPDDLETYKLLLPQYGDPNGDLRRIIQIVAPQKLTEFDDLRKELFLKSNNSVYRVIDEEIGKLRAGEFLGEKQTAIKNRTDADIVENARKLGYAPNEKTTIKEIGSATEYIQTTCSNLDIKSRTAFGVTYDTYDLAQKAIQNRKTCEHQWQYTITQSYPELCETLKQFQELNKTAPQGSVSDFVEKASAKEKKFRTINDVVYETYEIAQKAASNRSIAGQFLRQCSNANPFDLQDALQKVKSLNQEIPEGAVSDYIDKISEIEVATRTVNDVLYDTFELAEKARANRRDGEKLVQACDTTENIDVGWVLQRLQQLNHRDPVGSISDYVDEMLVKHFGRKDTKDYVLNGVLFPSIVERQDTECEFRLLIRKYMPGNPSNQGHEALKAELCNISNTSQLYKLVSAYIEDTEEALIEQQAREGAKAQIQQAEEATKIEVKQEEQSTSKRSRIRTGIALCFGVLFLNTILNVPLIVLDGVSCTFLDIINAAIHGGGMSAIALALLYVICGFYIIKELLKAVATLFTQRGNRRGLFGYSAWLCLFVIAFSIIGGNHFDCESRVFIWLIVSLVGYACIDNRH